MALLQFSNWNVERVRGLHGRDVIIARGACTSLVVLGSTVLEFGLGSRLRTHEDDDGSYWKSL